MLNTLLEAWCKEFAQALEMMTGNSHPVAVEPGSSVSGQSLWYSQRLAGVGVFAAGAEEHVWNELGTRALQGAGIDLIERDEARNTWFEIVQQSMSGAARAVAREGITVSQGDSGPAEGPPQNAQYFTVSVSTPDGLDLPICLAVTLVEDTTQADSSGTARGAGRNAKDRNRQLNPADSAMEVLLDVHLPISISFGNAQLRLKDVLNLTTGSVVELNRQPEEPVDIVVNDYVIARGEVVIVDGNYAVRIQEIVSRQDRMSLRDAGTGPVRRFS